MKLTITKLEAAVRQLDEAVRMLFEERDLIAVHTVAAAAGGILHDIAGLRGVYRMFDFIRPERQKEFLNAVRRPQNFFKHADRDPDGTLEFSAEQTHHVLLDATYSSGLLGIPPSLERSIFPIWYFVQYPDVFNWDAAPREMRQLRKMAEEIDPLDPRGLRWARTMLECGKPGSTVGSWHMAGSVKSQALTAEAPLPR